MPHRETEIKLEVRDPRVLRRRLRQLGFGLVRARHFERNLLFDFPDGRLRRAQCLLRLRWVGRQALLTFKGTPLRNSRYKVRREIETAVEEGAGLAGIFRVLGLCEVFRYEKYRTVLAPRGRKRGGAELVYDQTPVGDYVELEGPRRWIDQMARRLGYGPDDYITLSYAALYREKCRERGVKPGNMVFHK
jgi:adenylate cyclase, class 2